MKEDKITKRIKELQNDRRFMFKLTDDVIALVYRTAIEDCSKEKKDPDRVYKKDNDVVVESSKDLNKRFGSKRKSEDSYNEYKPWEEREKEAKLKSEAYADVLNYIEDHSDLMDVYVYVKEKAKEYYDIKIPNHSRWP